MATAINYSLTVSSGTTTIGGGRFLSTPITGLSVDLSTIVLAAPGSDNWPLTWASNGHQYTTFGDGAGFGATITESNTTPPRVSWGVSRIEGDFGTQTYANLNGGKNPENVDSESGEPDALPDGKSKGILALDGNLWMWQSGDGSNNAGYHLERLWKSVDHGLHWTDTGVVWTKAGDSKEFSNLCFIQYGQNMSAAPVHAGDYVYCLGFNDKNDTWEVQTPGEMILMRCLKTGMETKANWEFCTGTDPETWSSNHALSVPVFTDATNGLMRLSCVFNPKLQRYIMICQQGSRLKAGGRMGWYQAEFPWGPWTAIGTQPIDPWAFGTNGTIMEAGATKSVFWTLSPKWSFLNAQGTDFVLVGTFTDEDEYGACAGSFTI